jgi:hypothetical protein
MGAVDIAGSGGVHLVGGVSGKKSAINPVLKKNNNVAIISSNENFIYLFLVGDALINFFSNI